jgi:hypothetical protein
MKLNNIVIDTAREPTGMHITTAKEHGHVFEGETTSFTFEPPFIEVIPLVTVGLPVEHGLMSEHEHELAELPSVEAVEEDIPQPHRFSEHSHTYSSQGIGIEGPEFTEGILDAPPIAME